MAKRMIGKRRVSAALATLICASVGAVELRDPTRPPSFAELSPQSAPVRAPATRGTLTAIRIDANQRIATIGGQRIKVGDRVGDGSVRAIRRTEVVLATPTGNQVLKLYPGVQQRAQEGGASGQPRVASAGGQRRIARPDGIRQVIPKTADGGAAPAPDQGESQ